MSQDSRNFLYIPSLKKNSSRPIPGSAQDIIVQMKAPNRSPPLTRCLQIPGHFPPYTLSNVVLISCNHKKPNFRIFFFFNFRACPETPAVSTQSSTRGLRVPEQLERQAEFPSSDKTRPDSPAPTLQGHCCRSTKRRGSLRSCLPSR